MTTVKTYAQLPNLQYSCLLRLLSLYVRDKADRLSLAQFFKDQANESLLHAQEAGEIVTGLGGHPSLKIQIIEESNKHSTVDLLNESSEHEKEAVGLYKILLDIVKDESIYIEEYARGMIKAEEMHAIEVTKMLKDYAETS